MNFTNVGELSLAGVLLLLSWKLFEMIVGLIKEGRKVKNTHPGDSEFYFRESHGLMIKLVDLANDFDRKFSQGAFSCSWQGRDEVRDFEASIKDLTSEMKLLRADLIKDLAGEIKLLRAEMSRIRSGDKSAALQ
jgi:hypothetical protein